MFEQAFKNIDGGSMRGLEETRADALAPERETEEFQGLTIGVTQ